MQNKFNVTGMSCASCASHVEKAANSIPGVSSAAVNLLSATLSVEYDDNACTEAQIVDAVQRLGYGVVPFPNTAKRAAHKAELSEEAESLKKQFLYSLVFLIPLCYISMSAMLSLPVPQFFSDTFLFVKLITEFLLTTIVLFLNRKYFQRGLKHLCAKSPNMESLVAVGSGISYLYGFVVMVLLFYAKRHDLTYMMEQYTNQIYLESAAMIPTIVTLGKTFESKAKFQTGDAVRKLYRLRPDTAVVLEAEWEIRKNVCELTQNDIVIIKPGESIPIDGTVLSGLAWVNESFMTGESLPVIKEKGNEVIAGTVCVSGTLRISVVSVGNDTLLSKMIQMVEDAGTSKAPIARYADRVAGVFVPVVFAIAAITFVAWLLFNSSFSFALTSAVTVLVVSCPCAMGLATPIAVMICSGKGAELGILYKNAESMENILHANVLVLDKTGTITEGKPNLIHIESVRKDKDKLLQIAASLEKFSEHPFSNPILAFTKERNISLLPVDRFTNYPGYGIEGSMQNHLYRVGNVDFMTRNSVVIHSVDYSPQNWESVLYVSEDQNLLGILSLADRVKHDSPDAIHAFQQAGIAVHMLTGDSAEVANYVAGKVGIFPECVHANLKPSEKLAMIETLQETGHHVLMIGDGINDAPALVEAEIGMALGAGTDIAMESADVVLLRSSLMDAYTAFRLSKTMIHNIKISLFWAFIYNVICIPISAGVLYPVLGIQMNPAIGAAAMSLSSLCVVSNAMRLYRFQGMVNTTDMLNLSGTDHSVIADDRISEFKGERKMIQTLKVDGMMCAHCQKNVENAVASVEGTDKVVVSLENKEVQWEGTATKELVANAIRVAGYDVLPD